jgi:hypothetical protein
MVEGPHPGLVGSHIWLRVWSRILRPVEDRALAPLHALPEFHPDRYSALRPCYGAVTLTFVNDARIHAAVLALFDEVIAEGT